MKKNLIYILLLTFFGTGAFAQDGNKATTASDPLLQKIAAVKELAVKIDDAQKKVEAAATASRAAAQEANSALAALYKDYQTELEKQISLNTGNEPVKAALEKELKSVKEKNSPIQPTR